VAYSPWGNRIKELWKGSCENTEIWNGSRENDALNHRHRPPVHYNGNTCEVFSMAILKKGDQAPGFMLIDQSRKTIKLSDFKDRKLIVYFYPKSDTTS
jgi:hypothetical protein